MPPIRTRPVDPPAATRYRHPEEPFGRRSSRMMVQCGSALEEPAGVPRVAKPEPLKVKVMAELMAEGVQKRSMGSDFLTHRRPHPQADQHALRVVVAEQFGHPVFANPQRPGCQHPDTAGWGSVEGRRNMYGSTHARYSCVFAHRTG